MTHLDDAPVRPSALGQPLGAEIFLIAAQFSLDIDRAELAASDEVADIVGIARPLRQQRVGQVKHLLEIAVPRGEPQLGVEHRDAVAHIVEGDPQFGLTLADLVQQPGIVHRDDRLCREILE